MDPNTVAYPTIFPQGDLQTIIGGLTGNATDKKAVVHSCWVVIGYGCKDIIGEPSTEEPKMINTSGPELHIRGAYLPKTDLCPVKDSGIICEHLAGAVQATTIPPWLLTIIMSVLNNILQSIINPAPVPAPK